MAWCTLLTEGATVRRSLQVASCKPALRRFWCDSCLSIAWSISDIRILPDRAALCKCDWSDENDTGCECGQARWPAQEVPSLDWRQELFLQGKNNISQSDNRFRLNWRTPGGRKWHNFLKLLQAETTDVKFSYDNLKKANGPQAVHSVRRCCRLCIVWDRAAGCA